MADLNKRNFFEKFEEKVQNTNSKNYIAKTVRPFMWVGYLVGVFPVQNALTFGSAVMTVKKFSLAYFYSFLAFGFKVMVTIQLWNFLRQFNETVHNTQILTDFIAGSLAFIFGFCFGNFAHILSVWKLPSYLDTVYSLEAYDKKYKLIEHGYFTPGGQPWARLFFLIFTITAVVYTPINIFYRIVLSNESNIEYELMILPGLSTKNVLFLCFYVTFGLVILENGTHFLFFQIFSLRYVFHKRLQEIVKMVHDKNQDAMLASKGIDLQTWAEVKPNVLHLKSWEAIAEQYFDFLGIISKFQQFIGPYFTVLYSTSIIACVCLFYTLTNVNMPLNASIALGITIAFAFVRVFGLASIGECFKIGFKKLLKAVMVASVYQNLSGEEHAQFKGLMKHITTSKAMLSASGFFNVCNGNVTNIVSVIITYIIVLLQFKSADRKTVTAGPMLGIVPSYYGNFNNSDDPTRDYNSTVGENMFPTVAI